MGGDLVEAWDMSQEANLFLLKQVPAARLGDRYAARTRTVAAQFAHIHNVRLKWTSHADPELVGSAKPFPRDAAPTKTRLTSALRSSSTVIRRFLRKCEESGKVRSWSGSPATFLGYMVAHEAHHRGLVLVTLRLSGFKLSSSTVYGLWDWGKKSSRR